MFPTEHAQRKKDNTEKVQLFFSSTRDNITEQVNLDHFLQNTMQH